MAMAIFGECKANFVANNAVGHHYPRGGYNRVSWPRVLRDSLCTLSVIQVPYFASWGQGVVKVAVVGIVIKDLSLLLVAFISFVCPMFSNGGVDG